MLQQIVESKDIVTLVGGGDLSRPDLETVHVPGRTLVAADGGARHALAAGLMPDAVIGDFDSLEAEMRAALPAERLFQFPEQDSTDFEKCVSRITAPLVLALGFMGPRTDHQLATFHGLLRNAHRPCILVGAHQIVCLCPPKINLPADKGDLVSLFPLGTAQAESEGLEWPLKDVPLAPGRMVGTSNRATGGVVTIECATANLLLILPRSKLDVLASALPTATGRWPAPAG